MDPVLFTIGSFTVYTLGAFLAFAYLLGIFAFWRAGRREGFSSDDLLDLAFIVTFSALLGGRVLFLLLSDIPLGFPQIFQIGEGFMWVGAFLAGATALVIFARFKKDWSLFRISDSAAVSLALGQAFGFLGAEMVHYLPFAFYPAFGYLFLWIFMRYMRVRRLKVFPTFVYLCVSGVLVAFTEWLRPEKSIWLGFNFNYAGGLAIALAGLIGLAFAVAKKNLFKVKL